MNTKHLIIHADDFGFTPSISTGILHAIRHGVVTSTSVMLETPYRSSTKRLILNNADIDWGLHVMLDRLQQPPEIAIADETGRQIGLFQKYFGFMPSHIDFHKGFRFTTRMYFAVRMLALRHNVAFRYDNAHLLETRFYGMKSNAPTPGDITESALVRILNGIRPGVTEIICHPGRTGGRLRDPYRMQRGIELQTLTARAVKTAIHTNNIRLITYKDYARLSKRTP